MTIEELKNLQKGISNICFIALSKLTDKEARQNVVNDGNAVQSLIDAEIKRQTLTYGAKPCPFCGGEATMKAEGDYHEITCDDCGASRQGHTYDDAINEWNFRT